MRIRMKTLQAGPDGVRNAGEEYDVPEKEARQLIDGDYAVKVDAVDKAVMQKGTPRTATRRPGRTATKPKAGEPVEPPEDDDESGTPPTGD